MKNKKYPFNTLRYDDIVLGSRYSFRRVITGALVNQFAKISGDYSPLHMDEAYAKTTEWKGRILHGMLLASFFSTLVGMLIPGKEALYLAQNLQFKKPCRINQKVTITGEVISKSNATRTIELRTIIRDESGATLVEGRARVKVRA